MCVCAFCFLSGHEDKKKPPTRVMERVEGFLKTAPYKGEETEIAECVCLRFWA